MPSLETGNADAASWAVDGLSANTNRPADTLGEKNRNMKPPKNGKRLSVLPPL